MRDGHDGWNTCIIHLASSWRTTRISKGLLQGGCPERRYRKGSEAGVMHYIYTPDPVFGDTYLFADRRYREFTYTEKKEDGGMAT